MQHPIVIAIIGVVVVVKKRGGGLLMGFCVERMCSCTTFDPHNKIEEAGGTGLTPPKQTHVHENNNIQNKTSTNKFSTQTPNIQKCIHINSNQQTKTTTLTSAARKISVLVHTPSSRVPVYNAPSHIQQGRTCK